VDSAATSIPSISTQKKISWSAGAVNRMMQNKPVVLVSGGDGGIGSAIVEELSAHGYRLSLGSLDVGLLAERLGPESPDRIYQPFDAFDAKSAERWVARTAETFGQIDGVVNAIGGGRKVTIMDDDDAGLDLLWEIYVKTPLRLTRLCMPYLERCGRGRVINIVSLGGKRIRNVSVGYGVAKFAQMGLTHATRTYGWDKGVRATAISGYDRAFSENGDRAPQQCGDGRDACEL
jgi:NAD(P)-dependent dehydrogenase (short-subunit alcohol dehydrogenase family)